MAGFHFQSEVQLAWCVNSLPRRRWLQSKLFCHPNQIRKWRWEPRWSPPQTRSWLGLMASHAAVMGCSLEAWCWLNIACSFLHPPNLSQLWQHHRRQQRHSGRLAAPKNLPIYRQLPGLSKSYVWSVWLFAKIYVVSSTAEDELKSQLIYELYI